MSTSSSRLQCNVFAKLSLIASLLMLSVGTGFAQGPRIPHPDDPCGQSAESGRWSNAGTPDSGAQPPVVSAHRGALRLAPENTLWAYRIAFAYGADLVEVDVRESIDGVLFSLHDSDVSRTTNGSGNAHFMRWSRLSALNAADYGPWQGTAYDGNASIPRLTDIFALAAQAGAGVELDVKFVWDYGKLVDLVAQYGLAERSYYNATGLIGDYIRSEDPQARLIYNTSGDEAPWALYLRTSKYSVFGSGLEDYTPEKVAAIHDGCMLALPHSYDEGDAAEGAQWDHARSIGVDGVQTNQPDVIRTRQAAVDPSRKLPTALVAGQDPNQVCLVNANNGFGFPFLEVRSASGVYGTGIDGCVTLQDAPGVEQPSFAGNAALLPSAF